MALTPQLKQPVCQLRTLIQYLLWNWGNSHRMDPQTHWLHYKMDLGQNFIDCLAPLWLHSNKGAVMVSCIPWVCPAALERCLFHFLRVQLL